MSERTLKILNRAREKNIKDNHEESFSEIDTNIEVQNIEEINLSSNFLLDEVLTPENIADIIETAVMLDENNENEDDDPDYTPYDADLASDSDEKSKEEELINEPNLKKKIKGIRKREVNQKLRMSENDRMPQSITSLQKIANDIKLSLFCPRKDLCDLCFKYKNNNLSEEDYQAHIRKKDSAGEEKQRNKDRTVNEMANVITNDVQAAILLYNQSSSWLCVRVSKRNPLYNSLVMQFMALKVADCIETSIIIIIIIIIIKRKNSTLTATGLLVHLYKYILL
ncbi:unnamed protein product [Psylliodes chrysocephalus]|uniref:Uncharacterized protein n=1 Tax=Psylliodes chrysocephalus TaxID=3402493 RepID=A0A9P0G3L7_9CUCU|nr:unnamed protein product [Psylliodes chrysocephala]